jgi:hypothetical protein
VGEKTEIISKSYLSLFGGGFIDWINKRDGKYTKELAIEFSKYMMTKVSDPWNYTCIRQEAKPYGACYGDIVRP